MKNDDTKNETAPSQSKLSDLLPCPVCGGEAAYTVSNWERDGVAYVAVKCTECGLMTKPVTFEAFHNCGEDGVARMIHKNKAKELWNPRFERQAG